MPGTIAPVSYEPIKAVKVLSSQGNTPFQTHTPESATQTFKLGVPTMLSAGYIVEWTSGGANTVYGVSAEQAHNLTVSGQAQDLNDPASGPPPNQPSAIVTPAGAAFRDGTIGVYGANGQTVFSAALKLGQVFSQALLIAGTYYGLVKDNTSGFWYVDTTITNGNAAVVELVNPFYDAPPSAPNDAVLGARVFFIFAPTRRYFQ